MEFKDAITGKNINKKFGKFELDIPEIHIPEGFATAFIGENGAGKTTLLNILAGLRQDNKGEVRYFENSLSIDDNGVRERIGYSGTKHHLLPHWTGEQVKDLSKMLFDNFDEKKFEEICKAINIDDSVFGPNGKMIAKLSDGNKMKLSLATVFARSTDMLILDEPASPLDPLMRDLLSDMLRSYLADGNGQRTVVFSTHNISDMENVTDYIYVIDDGKILEHGFVTDIKEKYVLVKGDGKADKKIKDLMINFHENSFGYEGIVLSDKMDSFAGMNLSFETPGLFQISVALLKMNSKLRMPEM
ncbi:MAG: ABC transporter ATP-binding protein [Lachnospiraceae bacterium]|nr:ABC transporter ATP-binding protein [Lachnospiraceae bacterium]